MKGATVAFTILLLACSTGCTWMKVQVSILDSRVQRSPAWVQADVESREPSIRQRLSVGADGRDAFDRQKEKLHAQVAKLKQDILAYPQLQELNSKLPPYDGWIDEAFADAKAGYRQGLAALDQARDKQTPAAQESDDYYQAKADWQHADSALSGLTGRISTAMGPGTVLYDLISNSQASADTSDSSSNPQVASQARAAASSAKASAAASLQAPLIDASASAADSLIGDSGILNDPHASLVVGASKRYWKADFNRAFGWGSLGNTDIAVKMQSLGEFSLKGVRVDSSKVTAAAFSSITQAIKLVAIAEGVPTFAGTGTPTGTGSSTGSGGSGTAPGGAELTAEQNQQKAEAASNAARGAALAILSAITDENASLTSAKADDTTAVTAAAKRIQDTFTAYSPALTGGGTTPAANPAGAAD